MTISARPRTAVAAAALACFLIAGPAASAFEIWASEDGERSLSLDAALKCTSVLSYAPDDPALFPEREMSESAWRLRLGLEGRLSSRVKTELAYEQRSSILSEGAAASGILPSGGEAPYRIAQLDWPLVEVGDSLNYRHEIDRASVSFSPEWGELTVGRQAVGWGRGVLFSAVDIFVPFSPADIDREWRRGIDAARADVRLADRYSLDVVGAFGETWDESALAGRFRGYSGERDFELIFGKRAEDRMYAATFSSVAGEAELHAELAVFDVPEEPPDGGLFGADRLVGKLVLGGSYNFDVGDGLTVFAEYHYSGFGLKDVEEFAALASDSDFMERLARGDMQTLGRHAAALQASYGLGDALRAGLLWLQSLTDGSGLVAPSVSWDFAENVSLLASVYFPYGEPPEGGDLKSEYGAAPVAGFLQVRLYY